MLRRLHYCLIFFLSGLWFSFFQPWGKFLTPDAFYHAHLASLITHQGPIKNFPWLDLTSLHTHFADQHFLFHLLLIPFQKLFGELPGTQIAAVFFATLFITFFYFSLRRLRVIYPIFWIALALYTAPLLVRLSLGQASPFALGWFLFGLMALALRKPSWAVVSGLGFALFHGGWILLLLCQALFILGEVLFNRIVENQRWRASLSLRPINIFLLTILGIIIGLIIHPNFPQNFSFLWTQVFKIGIGTPFQHVLLGSEWIPASPSLFFSLLAPEMIIAFFLVIGFVFARPPSLDQNRARLILGTSFPLAVLFALPFKSYRFIEYLVPVFILWLALLASLLDWKKIKKYFLHTTSRRRLWVGGIIVLLLYLFCSVRIMLAWKELHDTPRTFIEFQSAMQAISAQAKSGDRVFHSNWDQFPQLFVLDDRLRYIAGLDPTFLYEASPTLSDAYRDVTLGRKNDQLYQIIHDQFQAKFVFVEQAGHELFYNALQKDSRFSLLFQDATATVYQVK